MRELIHFVAWVGRNKPEEVGNTVVMLLTEYVGGPAELDSILNEIEEKIKQS
jgi:hypothetical protein